MPGSCLIFPLSSSSSSSSSSLSSLESRNIAYCTRSVGGSTYEEREARKRCRYSRDAGLTQLIYTLSSVEAIFFVLHVYVCVCVCVSARGEQGSESSGREPARVTRCARVTLIFVIYKSGCCRWPAARFEDISVSWIVDAFLDLAMVIGKMEASL